MLLRDRAITFLAGHAGPICATCLGARLGVEFAQAYDAWQDLELRHDFRVGRGRCTVCRRVTEVIRGPLP